ncbi:MAG: Cache 3/Cache 2 fusion domain-containing protein, partial [Burkholderiaceae bacterium]|nr:Cache 3/Cache 2 fusion domain-containing protein [Burkholderiaceae bacterium]
MFKRLSLTQRLLAGTALAITLAFGILLAITVQQSRQGAVEQAELGMRTQLDLVVTMLDYAQESLKTRARDQLTLLEHELPGKASLGAPVATGKRELPRLRFGELEGNNNPEFLEAYRKRNGVDAAFLVREGDTFYRASTLLKDADGKHRVGEAIKDAYAATLLRGETYTGTLERGGRLYVLGAKPVLGADGKVIGGITVRLDAEANVTMLKDRLRNIAVGSSGYLYVLAPPSGDSKESRVLMHPQHEGKRLSELDANTIRPVLEKQLAERNGTHRYAWTNASGRQLEKIAMFKEQKELGWIVASSTAIDELTAASAALRNLLLGLSVGFGLLLCAGIGGYIWTSLRRLQPVTQGIEALAAGDLG